MAAGSRPFGVTLVGLLIVLSGIVIIIGSLVAFFSGDSAGVGLVALIVSLLIGLIYVGLARGIFHGSSGARMVVALLTVISIIDGVLHLFTFLWLGLWQVLAGLIILGLLYSARAKEFFR